MFPMLVTMLLFAAITIGLTGVSNAATPPLSNFDNVQWPLDRVGAQQTTLQVPSAYGTGSPVARQFSAATEKKDAFRQETYTAGTPLCFGSGQSRTCYRRNAPDVKSSQYGLQRVGVDFSKYPAFPEVDRSALDTRDVYFLRGSAGVVSTLIVCTAEEAKTAVDGPAYKAFAHCEHKFIAKKLNALIQINYPRPQLEHWSDIQTRWLSLLDSFAPDETGGRQ